VRQVVRHQPPAADQLVADGHGDGLRRDQPHQHEHLRDAGLHRAAAAEDHPDERAGQRDQADGPGLVQPGDQRLGQQVPGDDVDGLPGAHAERQAGLQQVVVLAQGGEHPAAGQGVRGHGAADHDAGEGDQRGAVQRHGAGAEDDREHRQHAGGHRGTGPRPGAGRTDPPGGGEHGDREHDQRERGGQPERAQHRGEDQRDGGELDHGAGGGDQDRPVLPQAGDQRGGDRDSDEDEEGDQDPRARFGVHEASVGGPGAKKKKNKKKKK
jgi:hypothetical protein